MFRKPAHPDLALSSWLSQSSVLANRLWTKRTMQIPPARASMLHSVAISESRGSAPRFGRIRCRRMVPSYVSPSFSSTRVEARFSTSHVAQTRRTAGASFKRLLGGSRETLCDLGEEPIAHLSQVGSICRVIAKESLLDQALDDVQETDGQKQTKSEARVLAQTQRQPRQEQA